MGTEKISVQTDIDDTLVKGHQMPGSKGGWVREAPVDLMIVKAYAREKFVPEACEAETIKLYKAILRGKMTIAEATKEFYPMMADAKVGKAYKDAVEIIRKSVVPYLILYPRTDYIVNAVRQNPGKVTLSPITFNSKEAIDALRDRIPFDMLGVYNEQKVDSDGKFEKGFVRKVIGDKAIAYKEFIEAHKIPLKYTIGLGDSLLQDGWVNMTRFPHLFNEKKTTVRRMIGRESLTDTGEFREAFTKEIEMLLGELDGTA